MSQTVITKAFEQLKAQQAANGSIVLLDEFVFANVPDLNITDPIDRNESLPAESLIVHRQDVSKTGMVNENAVVYSVAMGADTGDFEFNWIGLLHKESNTVAMIVHAPLQKKIKTAAGQQGNVLTRSFLMEYSGASQQTQIITPADTWQIDFTARLSAVDERIRQENVDVWGAAGFIGDGFLLTHDTGNKYTLKNGVGYVSGLRAELLASQALTIASRPSKVWVDVCWRGTLTSEWRAETKITVADALADYTLGDEQHFVFAVAEVDAAGAVTDLRPVGNVAERNMALTGLLKALNELDPSAKHLLGFDTDKRLSQFGLSDYAAQLLSQEDAESAQEYLKLDKLPDTYLSRENPFADIKSDGDEAINKALSHLGIKQVATQDVVPAKLGGTGATTIAGMLSNFGLTELVKAGIALVEVGTNFLTVKIPWLDAGVRKYLMIHAITAVMPTNTNGYNLTVTYPTAYDGKPWPMLSSSIGIVSTTGGTTESMNVQSISKESCVISSAWQTWTSGEVYLWTIGTVTA